MMHDIEVYALGGRCLHDVPGRVRAHNRWSWSCVCGADGDRDYYWDAAAARTAAQQHKLSETQETS